MRPNSLYMIWVIFRKDFIVWLRNPRGIALSTLPVFSILVIQVLAAAAVGRNPVALVTLDHRPKGNQMHQIFYQADVFDITDASPQQAQALLKNLEVVAVITIPANFTQRVNAHENSPVDVTVNNLNLDFTDDVRRSVPDAITQFYEAQGSASPIKLAIHEQDLRRHDVPLFAWNILPTVALLLMVNGLVNNGNSVAREWETRTIKELLLSPVPRPLIIIGKALAGFVTSLFLALLVLLLGATLGWTQPTSGIYWLTTVLTLALIALMGTGLGVTLGATLRRVQVVTPIAVLVAFYLYFLAGGIGILAFQPIWLQNVAAYVPLTYGIHALQMAVFYSSSELFGRDVLVLSLSALAAIGLGVFSLRRGIAS